jgi:MSHA biogenesis protein MshQ
VSSSVVTVTLRDGASNPVPGRIVALTAGSGSSIISAASGPSNGSGVVTFTVRDTVVESVTYTAADTTSGIVLSQTATVAFGGVGKEMRFNVVERGADPVFGRIFTKVAGQAFALDIVAIDSSNALVTNFIGQVAIEIVDNTSGGPCDGLPVIAAFANQDFVKTDLGRHALSAANAVSNVYRNAKVRVRFPVASSKTTSCSTDNFAVRPALLVLAQPSNGSRTTPGTANVLDNLAIPGPPARIHSAGRPFTVAATAMNGAAAPAVTSNYDGSPVPASTPCVGAACPANVGGISVGPWTAAGGVVTTNTAAYDDVGAFTLQLSDNTFAAVDSGDGTSQAQLTIPSTAVTVGRFVPDHFELAAGSSITPRTDVAACSGSTFTYMDEEMEARFTLIASKFPTGTTPRYAGALGRLVLAAAPGDVPAVFNFGAIDTSGPTPLSARLNAALGSTGGWANGRGEVTAKIAIRRNPAPDGPYNNIRLGIASADPDGVALGAVSLDLDADMNGAPERAQVGAGTAAVRFGRLRLSNSHGSQLIGMPIPLQLQYWNGTVFVPNIADTCTSFTPANVAFGNWRNMAAGATAVASVSAFNAGNATLRLSAPGGTAPGSVDVSINVSAAAAGAACAAPPPSTPLAPSTPSNKTYLQGAWCGAAYASDPAARATFGVYRGSDRMIYQRENY